MLQIIRAVLKNPQDKTQLWLIFANKTEDDILLRKELEAIPKNRLKLFYTLDEPPAGWKQGKGFISEQLLKRVLPAASDDVLVCVCGPPGMMTAVSGGKTPDYKQGELTGLLKALGFSESNVFKF